MFGMSPQELFILVIVILFLSRAGVWPIIVRGLRELRGEHVPDPEPSPPPSGRDMDICYKLLGISPSAPWEDIERAYRQKAKIHHPDRGGDGDAMRALNDAYSTIKRLRGR